METIYSNLWELPSFSAALLFLMICSVVYFHTRSGSSYGLLSRFYTLITGGNDFYDTSLQNFWKTRQDVERFNALFNIGAKSIDDAKKFKAWIETHNLEINRVSSTSGYFDFQNMRIRKVKPTKLILSFSAVLFFLAFSCLSFGIGVTDYAIVRFTDDQKWFGLNKNEAKSIRVNPFSFNASEWVISEKVCKLDDYMHSQQVISSKLNRYEVDFVCGSFTNGAEIKRINSIKDDQSKFIFLSMISSVLFLGFINKLFRLIKVKEARTYVMKNT